MQFDITPIPETVISDQALKLSKWISRLAGDNSEETAALVRRRKEGQYH